MVQKVQLHTKFLLFLFVAAITFGCSTESNNLSIKLSDPHLKKKKGVYYYNNSPFNGELVVMHNALDTAEVGNYVDGRREGLCRRWWENGNVKYEAYFHNGEYNGKVIEWYSDGQLFSSFNYINGKESGRQKMWNRDGSFKANYDVIGDRKYGLTGVKNCSNVWED